MELVEPYRNDNRFHYVVIPTLYECRLISEKQVMRWFNDRP